MVYYNKINLKSLAQVSAPEIVESEDKIPEEVAKAEAITNKLKKPVVDMQNEIISFSSKAGDLVRKLDNMEYFQSFSTGKFQNIKGIIESLKNVGYGSKPQVADGVWGKNTNANLNNLIKITESLCQYFESTNFNFGYAISDIENLKKLIPVDEAGLKAIRPISIQSDRSSKVLPELQKINKSIDGVLSSSDLGQFISDNKKPFGRIESAPRISKFEDDVLNPKNIDRVIENNVGKYNVTLKGQSLIITIKDMVNIDSFENWKKSNGIENENNEFLTQIISKAIDSVT